MTQKGFEYILLFLFKHQVDAVDNKAICDDIKHWKEWYHFRDTFKAMNMNGSSY